MFFSSWRRCGTHRTDGTRACFQTRQAPVAGARPCCPSRIPGAAWFFDVFIFRGTLVFDHVAAPGDGRAPHFEDRPEKARHFAGLLTKQKPNRQPKDYYEQSEKENGR